MNFEQRLSQIKTWLIVNSSIVRKRAQEGDPLCKNILQNVVVIKLWADEQILTALEQSIEQYKELMS